MKTLASALERRAGATRGSGAGGRLADPTRRRIVDRLARGTATVSELVDCFDLTQPTISSHLKVLERSGLISRSRVAQTRPCNLNPEGFKALDVWLGQLRSVYEANYARLATSTSGSAGVLVTCGRTPSSRWG